MAMPIDVALPVIRQIVKQGYAARNYLGMSVVAMTAEVVRSQKRLDPRFDVEEGKGLLVTSVTPSGPADKAGMKPGDIMLAIDEESTNSFGAMFDALSVYEPGRVITVTMLSKGKLKLVELTPTALPSAVRPRYPPRGR